VLSRSYVNRRFYRSQATPAEQCCKWKGLTFSARILSHGVIYGVQEGYITFPENLSLEVRKS
jgi:hypothetical protein